MKRPRKVTRPCNKAPLPSKDGAKKVGGIFPCERARQNLEPSQVNPPYLLRLQSSSYSPPTLLLGVLAKSCTTNTPPQLGGGAAKLATIFSLWRSGVEDILISCGRKGEVGAAEMGMGVRTPKFRLGVCCIVPAGNLLEADDSLLNLVLEPQLADFQVFDTAGALAAKGAFAGG